MRREPSALARSGILIGLLIGLCATPIPTRALPGAAGSAAGRTLRLEEAGWSPWRSLMLTAADRAEERDAAQPVKRLSRVRSVGASLLLPGLGQRANGHMGRARAYLTAEAAIWVGVLASEIQGHIRKNRYIDYAESFAGVEDAGDRPDWFYRNLGNYASYDAYRDDIARSARAIYGDDLEAREAYVAENLRGVPAWEWQSRAHRLEFRERRKDSRNAYRRAGLFIGAALLNRLVSAVDAAWISGRKGPREEADARAVFYLPGEDGGYVCVRWTPAR